MSYDSAITELRQLISDTEYHKKVSKKKLIGAINGENVSFLTYDKRILEDTFQAYVNDVAVDATVEDAIKGEITLSSPPDKNTKVEASYYWRFWLDSEIINFLNKGAEATSQWTSEVPDNAYLQILPGLKTAALMLAASLATRSFIQYVISRRHSEEFLLEQDGNDDNNFSQAITALQKVADQYWKDGLGMRDDFYQRQGKRNAPAFGIRMQSPRQYGPRR